MDIPHSTEPNRSETEQHQTNPHFKEHTQNEDTPFPNRSSRSECVFVPSQKFLSTVQREIKFTTETLTTSIDYGPITVLSFNWRKQYLCSLSLFLPRPRRFSIYIYIYFRLFMSLIDPSRIKYRTPFFHSVQWNIFIQIRFICCRCCWTECEFVCVACSCVCVCKRLREWEWEWVSVILPTECEFRQRKHQHPNGIEEQLCAM